jgi:hypothetical protein
MALKEDLESEVAEIFQSQWTTRNGTVVPSPSDIKLKNDAVNLTGTVLYADLSVVRIPNLSHNLCIGRHGYALVFTSYYQRRQGCVSVPHPQPLPSSQAASIIRPRENGNRENCAFVLILGLGYAYTPAIKLNCAKRIPVEFCPSQIFVAHCTKGQNS